MMPNHAYVFKSIASRIGKRKAFDGGNQLQAESRFVFFDFSYYLIHRKKLTHVNLEKISKKLVSILVAAKTSTMMTTTTMKKEMTTSSISKFHA